MGLESVELVMDLEDEYGITIPNDATERIRTVGELVDFIDGELEAQRRDVEYCASARAFHDLRRHLCELLQVPRKAIRPQTEVHALVPRDRRREVWGAMKARGLELPGLCLSELATGWIGGGVVLLAGGLALAFANAWLLVSIVPLGLLAMNLARPIALEVDRVFPTIGDLATYLAARRTSARSSSHSRADILRTVRVFVAELWGIPLEEITAESDFSKELAR